MVEGGATKEAASVAAFVGGEVTNIPVTMAVADQAPVISTVAAGATQDIMQLFQVWSSTAMPLIT